MNDITYLTDTYDEKIKRIKAINAPLNFVFITDLHNRMNCYDEAFVKAASGEKKYESAVDHRVTRAVRTTP